MELVRWLETFEGSVFDKRVEIQETQFGKGLVAVEDLPAGTTLLEIPRDAILTVSHAIKDERVANTLENVDLVLNGCEVLAIYYYLHGDNPNDKFYLYFSSLPSEYSSPVLWESENVEKLPFGLSNGIKTIKARISKIASVLKFDDQKFTKSFCALFTRSFSSKLSAPEIIPKKR